LSFQKPNLKNKKIFLQKTKVRLHMEHGLV